MERRSAKNLREAFREMHETLYPGASTFADVMQQAAEIERLARDDQALRDAVARMLLEGVDLGVTVAVDQLGPIGFDYTLANITARDWAQEYTYKLISQIDDTTTRTMRQAVARWIENGEPLQALIDDLAPTFGAQRAELIASTEVTRAYQRGSEEAWRQSGVVSQIVWQTVLDERVCRLCGPLNGKKAPLDGTFEGNVSPPPRHPRCRCFTRPVIE